MTYDRGSFFFAGQMVRSTEARIGRSNMDEGSGGAGRDGTVRTVLVAADADFAGTALSKLHVLEVVGRRSLPSIIEATIVPAVLFYVVLMTIGASAAMLAALAWSYAAVLRRYLSGRQIPGILQLAVVGLTVRTAIGIVSGTFIYFLQPVATTLALSLVFLGSLRFGRPMIARMASDFCPLEPEIALRPSVIKLFSGLTLMWAGVHLLSASATFAMLLSLPTATFVLLRSGVSLAITGSAVALTISWAMRTARAENLMFPRVPI